MNSFNAIQNGIEIANLKACFSLPAHKHVEEDRGSCYTCGNLANYKVASLEQLKRMECTRPSSACTLVMRNIHPAWM